ncbi:MAG: DEAD/DEAH box helicase [Candidatus Delongbacteria bacterium]|jgi:ATP-dependent RNA helicase DeaD|nr:DEAD/DEAH box helicase [Candidatus Delongbacteria bacterium]MDY0016988.1 DEAD/DEAH box helicase [Candidatus Delongbacteria bacterium]
MMKEFREAGLREEIIDAISEMGFVKPTPIQDKTISHLLASDRDLIGLAQTGTGKTAAFGLPIIQRIDPKSRDTQALVLCPTRELCMQITKDFNSYSKYLPKISVAAVYGGASIDNQIRALKKGVHIVVGTPGRVLDLINRHCLMIDAISFLVLDEADEMLNMGFKEDLDTILSSAKSERQTMLFSATMPREIAQIAKNYMNDPEEISAGQKNAGAENVQHHYYLVHARDRYLALKRIADVNPDIYGIIFCRTREETQEVADKLIADGYNADALHGNLSQAQRDLVMNRFRTGHLQLLVATDVAARGIDVNNLSHIINYNLPDDPDIYLHRSGRTGRAGRSGISISVVHMKEKSKLRMIEQRSKIRFEQKKVPGGINICEMQLFNLVDRVVNVEVNKVQIERFLPYIYDKLGDIDRDTLIQKFISLEFNRFLEYYKDAPDLNQNAQTAGKSTEREKGRGGSGRESFIPARSGKQGSFSRFFINAGSRDGLDKPAMIKLIATHLRNRDIEIGKVDLLKNFSFFEIESSHDRETLKAFSDAEFKGRPLNVELTDKKPFEKPPEKKKFKRK